MSSDFAENHIFGISRHHTVLGQYVEFSEAVGLIFTKNESEYPKTERGGSNPEWAIAHEGLLLNKN